MKSARSFRLQKRKWLNLSALGICNALLFIHTWNKMHTYIQTYFIGTVDLCEFFVLSFYLLLSIILIFIVDFNITVTLFYNKWRQRNLFLVLEQLIVLWPNVLWLWLGITISSIPYPRLVGYKITVANHIKITSFRGNTKS